MNPPVATLPGYGFWAMIIIDNYRLRARIVEIEERDFYFEISPEDYQVEEANIRNNKENKKSINPSGESRCTRALMLRLISRIREAYSVRGSSNNRSTQEEIRIVFGSVFDFE